MLNQAQSISTSYPAITKQAELGKLAHTGVDKWLKEGFNSAKTRIMNNTNEEIEITNVGITAKTYDDITETYDDEQLRITHNILAFTDDNWETIKTALGKFTFTYYEPHLAKRSNIKQEEAYGLVAEAVLAGWVVGSVIEGTTFVGGHIQNPTNSTYISLTDEKWVDYKNRSYPYFIDANGKFLVTRDGNIKTFGGHFSNMDNDIYVDVHNYDKNASDDTYNKPYFLRVKNSFFVTKEHGIIISKSGRLQNSDNTSYIDCGDGTYYSVDINGDIEVKPEPYFLRCKDPNTFSVTKDGYLVSTSGRIGGFYITSKYISSNMNRELQTVTIGNNTYAAIALSNTPFEREILTAGDNADESDVVTETKNIEGLQFAIGSTFGVTDAGTIYCSDLYSSALKTYKVKAHSIAVGSAWINGITYDAGGVVGIDMATGYQFKSSATALGYHTIYTSAIERHMPDGTIDTVAYLKDVPKIEYSDQNPPSTGFANGTIWLVFEN